MSGYRALVADALDALQIESPTAFAWYGRQVAALSAAVAAVMDAETTRGYLVYTLQNHLYGSFYCRGFAVVPSTERALPHVGWTPFVQALSEANGGEGSRDPGWVVTDCAADGRIVVARDGLSLWVRPEDVVGESLEPGASLSVIMPKELLRLSPGFYLALGNEEFASDDTIVRVYWHLRNGAAAGLVGGITRPLNDAGVPFRLKVLVDPDSYTRCDSGVLYVLRRDYARVAPTVASVRRSLGDGLRGPTPVFTKQLADGLGLAEEPPGSADSFGMHRCRLMAEALADAFAAGVTSGEGRLGAIEERFAGAELSFDKPYLNPDSSDEYVLPA